ncbi:MAG: UPF0280 family protein [Candidatus Omnitrophica bacterium]|nr:UPF0280 family protein [Candidatus Omnitrophota bacterium]
MKSCRYQRRFYRDWARPKDLYSSQLVIKETDLHILTDKPLNKDFLKQRLNTYRLDIERYIIKDKRFLTALKPIPVELNASRIIKRMSQAAKRANVGPMAAVAGAIAEFLGQDLLKQGYREVIIENGGDIFLKTEKTRKIAIYPGRLRYWRGLSLKINPRDTPLGICTSSGTVGHSLNFGYADSVVVLSKNVSLADAVATATANLVQSEEHLNRAINFSKDIKGILGVVIIIKKHLACWGDIEFVY